MTTPEQLARAMHGVVEPLHAIAYFAPQMAAAWEELGLEPRGQGYFAGRAAPFGRVDAGPVAAAFYNFNPVLIAAMIPAVWDVAPPERVLAARARGMEAVYAGLELPTEHVAEATDLLRRAGEAVEPAGRPLAAANLAVAPSGSPFGDLWQAVTVLREHRGDGHVALLTTVELTPVEALVLYANWQDRVSRRFLQATRFWDDDAWQAGIDRLTERGLADADGLTAAGAALRDDLETRTDTLAAGPWRHLGEDATRRAWELLHPLAVTVGGAFPRPFEVPDDFPG